VLQDGSTYIGEVRNNKPNGYGTRTDTHGNNHTGTFTDGEFSGSVVVAFHNGD
jgi:hypothetical protein